MKQEGYVIRDQFAAHFVTFQVVDWVDIFSRKIYRDIVIDSFCDCREKLNLLIHGYVIMTNHVHCVLRSKSGNLSDTIGSIKKFTSRKIHQTILSTPESRADWMLKRFEFASLSRGRDSDFQLWTSDNNPKEIYSHSFMWQKLNYIHDNPVRAGIVEEQHHYLYSSARNYNNMFSIMDIDLVDP